MKIKYFLQLIRYKNLLMLIFMIVIFKYSLIPNYTIVNTLLLTFSILFITIAGNIINDIFDVDIDAINKPKKNSIGVYISKNNAYYLYYSLNIIGFLFGFYLSIQLEKPFYTLIFILTILLLFIYSKSLKKNVLIGNVVVSFLISLTIFLVYLFNQLNDLHSNLNYFLVYAFFAFFLNFIREIVKDIEDIKGDSKYKLKTLPILIGLKKTKNIVISLTIIPLVLSSYFVVDYFSVRFFLSFYIIFLIIFPLSYIIIRLFKVTQKEGFSKLSSLLKIIMFFGMLSVLFFK